MVVSRDFAAVSEMIYRCSLLASCKVLTVLVSEEAYVCCLLALQCRSLVLLVVRLAMAQAVLPRAFQANYKNKIGSVRSVALQMVMCFVLNCFSELHRSVPLSFDRFNGYLFALATWKYYFISTCS